MSKNDELLTQKSPCLLAKITNYTFSSVSSANQKGDFLGILKRVCIKSGSLGEGDKNQFSMCVSPTYIDTAKKKRWGHF